MAPDIFHPRHRCYWRRLRRDEFQASVSPSQHGERIGELDTHCEARVGDEHPLLRVRLRSFVCDQSMTVRTGMSDEEIIGRVARESIDRRRSVLTTVRPCAQIAKLGGRRLIKRPEESRVSLRPIGEFVCSGEEFLLYRIDRAGQGVRMRMIQLVPEAGGDVKGVVTILRLDQHVGVDEVHQATPSCSASPMRVSCFLVPRSW